MDIVDTLRKVCPEEISFVAECEEKIVGHILFIPAVIKTKQKDLWEMELAPMSVLPEFQRQGIGTLLVQTGLDETRKTRQPFIIALGHPMYYPRFGYIRASCYRITSQYSIVPDEAFMILILDEGAFSNVSGVGMYRAEFDITV